MRVVNLRSWLHLTLAALLIPLAALSAAGQQRPDSAHVTQLLQQARGEAARLATEADALSSYTRSAVTWESHSSQIQVITDHINQLGKTVESLNDAKGEASDWQQQAIDHVTPLAQELASDIQTTINHLNENKTRLRSAPYTEYVKANAENSQQLANLIRDYVSYGQAKVKYEELSDKLGTPR